MISFPKEDIKGRRTKNLTKLQSVIVVFLLLSLIAFSINSIITYGVDKRPSITLFENSQTVQVFSDQISSEN